MAIAICTKDGSIHFTNGGKDDIIALKQQIAMEEVIPIWWYSNCGQRYYEWIYYDPDNIAYIRTESDDG